MRQVIKINLQREDFYAFYEYFETPNGVLDFITFLIVLIRTLIVYNRFILTD